MFFKLLECFKVTKDKISKLGSKDLKYTNFFLL